MSDESTTPELVLAVVRHDGRPAGSTGYFNTRQAYVSILEEGMVTQ